MACVDGQGRACARIDEQEDLCSRCASEWYARPIDKSHPFDALERVKRLEVVIRVQRWMLRQMAARLEIHDDSLRTLEAIVADWTEPMDADDRIWIPGE